MVQDLSGGHSENPEEKKISKLPQIISQKSYGQFIFTKITSVGWPFFGHNFNRFLTIFTNTQGDELLLGTSNWEQQVIDTGNEDFRSW